MGRYFTDLFNILSFFWELFGNFWFWISPIIVPLVLPAWAIYLTRRKKRIFKIPGAIFLVLALLWMVIWVYMYLRAGNFHYHPTSVEAIKDMPGLLEILAIFYLGVYTILEKKKWVNAIGWIVVCLSFIYYFACIYIAPGVF